MRRTIATINLYGKSGDLVYSTPKYIKLSLISLGYMIYHSAGDFNFRHEFTDAGEFKMTLVIYNRKMLEDSRVKELLLEYMI